MAANYLGGENHETSCTYPHPCIVAGFRLGSLEPRQKCGGRPCGWLQACGQGNGGRVSELPESTGDEERAARHKRQRRTRTRTRSRAAAEPVDRADASRACACACACVNAGACAAASAGTAGGTESAADDDQQRTDGKRSGGPTGSAGSTAGPCAAAEPRSVHDAAACDAAEPACTDSGTHGVIADHELRDGNQHHDDDDDDDIQLGVDHDDDHDDHVVLRNDGQNPDCDYVEWRDRLPASLG